MVFAIKFLTLRYGLSNGLLATASSNVFQHLTLTVNRKLWIAIFLLTTLMLNAFNVSLLGKTGFWITSIKMLFILALIVLGLILPMDAVSSCRALGTVNGTVSFQCESCSLPGFNCISFRPGWLRYRLEGNRVQGVYCPSNIRIPSGVLGMLFSCCFLLHRLRGPWNNRCQCRKATRNLAFRHKESNLSGGIFCGCGNFRPWIKCFVK
jgi:hypothetical protein